MVRRMVESGANVVWIGHNNPGEVDATKVEPGLSYAVFEAYRDPGDPRHIDAVAIVDAQHRLLAACRQIGVKAVLPIGYQIQMGQRWNQEHPGALRRDVQGELLDIYGGGVSASFYAPIYRQDIETYYKWVEDEFVQPYADVILMLNLADEPIGGDYSAHADVEFRRLHGFGFEGVDDVPHRQRLLGQFQSRYVAEYAAYSAELWHEIHPGLPVTMSFDGGQARKTFSLPDVEALFRDTPSNFVVTLDAYPRDGLPHVALSDKNLVGLYLLARSLGLYSSRYDKPVWVWAAANSWGLSQASPDPGSISDAVSNGISLALLIRQGGGDLQGVAYWNYNVKEQGLYNDIHQPAYDIEVMFAQVSTGFSTVRHLMKAPIAFPQVFILASPTRSHREIGAAREPVRLEVQPFRQLSILAKEGINATVVESLVGWPLEQVRSIVVLSPGPVDLATGDVDVLREFLGRGGKVVAPRQVAAQLVGPSGAEPRMVYDGLVEQRGDLYIAQKGMAVLFEDKRHAQLRGLWREVLGLKAPRPGYRVVTDHHAFYYNLGPDSVTVCEILPFEVLGYRYDDQARPVERLRGSYLCVKMGRREYAFFSRVQRSRPFIE